MTDQHDEGAPPGAPLPVEPAEPGEPAAPTGPRANGHAAHDRLAPAVEALPGLARVAASAAWHTTGWGVRTSLRSTARLARAVTDPHEAAALAHEATEAVQVVSDLARSVSAGIPVSSALVRAGETLGSFSEVPERPDRGGRRDAEESATTRPAPALPARAWRAAAGALA